MKNINDDKMKNGLFSLSTWWKRHNLAAELNAMDTCILEDIGISRNEISDIVDRSFPQYTLKETVELVIAKVLAFRANQQAAWELSGFDDRMLADIGLYRSDISSIAQGHYPERENRTAIAKTHYPERENKAANDDHQRAA